ncbi:hypothetical protein Btru_061262 [Bulinus truncatus]|nr:hypothetical protein Btru_061262 [Bulinus truncatus]
MLSKRLFTGSSRLDFIVFTPASLSSFVNRFLKTATIGIASEIRAASCLLPVLILQKVPELIQHFQQQTIDVHLDRKYHRLLNITSTVCVSDPRWYHCVQSLVRCVCQILAGIIVFSHQYGVCVSDPRWYHRVQSPLRCVYQILAGIIVFSHQYGVCMYQILTLAVAASR